MRPKPTKVCRASEEEEEGDRSMMLSPYLHLVPNEWRFTSVRLYLTPTILIPRLHLHLNQASYSCYR
jgi:hypothetical protein